MNSCYDRINGSGWPDKEYAAVDLFKFLCCLMVIAIHTKPFAANFWLDAAVGLSTRFAVPYFFAASSFFLFLRLSNADVSSRSGVLLGYINRLFILYGFWYVIHNLIAMTRGNTHSLEYYIRQFVIPTNGSPLWFMAALILATAIVFILNKWFQPRSVFFISILFLLMGYCFSTLGVALSGTIFHSGFLEKVVSVIGTQNGLFFGFPYVALGALLVQQEQSRARSRDLKFAALWFGLLGLESLLAVTVFNAQLTFLWLSALPMTYFVMRYTLATELKNKKIYYYLRKMSTLIYLVHPPLVFYIKTGIGRVGLIDSHNLLLFLGTAIISILIGLLIIELSKHKRLAFLRYIY